MGASRALRQWLRLTAQTHGSDAACAGAVTMGADVAAAVTAEARIHLHGLAELGTALIVRTSASQHVA